MIRGIKKPYRNKEVSKYIREEMTCCITGRSSPDPHHLIGCGYSATGTKADDWAQMAITHELHDELHRHGWKAFEDKYGICQKVMVTETLLALHEQGVISLDDLDLPDWFHELKDFFNE